MLKPESPAPLALSSLDELVGEAISEARASGTRDTYRIQWERWADWAEEHGVPALPARPEDVARYLAYRAKKLEHAYSTVGVAAAAIWAKHKDAGHAALSEHPGIRLMMRGLARLSGREPRQVKPLDGPALDAICRTALLPRTGRKGQMERRSYAERRGTVDIALVCTMSDGGLRRGEAAALEWRDLEVRDDGGRLTIRRSKTDQEGAGAVVALTPYTVDALERLRALRGDAVKVFGISARQIATRIASAAKAAGLKGRYSGHSGRVGLAVRMARAGAPTNAVMRQGRWEAYNQVVRYTRAEDAGQALQWLTR